MKMEMSYRDKVILIVLLILLVLVGGFFALIKPKYEAWQASKSVYETTKVEWDGIEQKKSAIPNMQKAIKDDYNEYKKTAEIFVNNAFVTVNADPRNGGYENQKTSYEIDKYLQPMIDECSLEVNGMTLPAVSAQTISYYYYQPDVLTYSLLEAADVNGNFNAEVGEIMKETRVLSERTVGDVMCQSVQLNVNTTKENLMLFLEKLDADPNAVRIANVNIANYAFNDGLTSTTTGPDGQPITITAPGEGTSKVDITINFYNAKPIDEPNLGEGA